MVQRDISRRRAEDAVFGGGIRRGGCRHLFRYRSDYASVNEMDDASDEGTMTNG